MPFAYRIAPDDGTLYVTVAGDVGLEELQEGLDRISRDPALSPGPRIVSDHRGIERAASFDHVDAVLDHFKAHREQFRGSRWAMVITRPDSYGMMRVLSALTEMRNEIVVQIFDDLDDAVSWVLAPTGVSVAR